MKIKILSRSWFLILAIVCLSSCGGDDKVDADVNNNFIAKDFTVGQGRRVVFSQGNLQYQASTKSWRFAAQQYSVIGQDNRNISSTNSGWIDLFGWATSGYNNSNPYQTSINYSIYGQPISGLSLVGAYANYDWGVYNAIENGGITSGLWRTLTQEEWNYLFHTRSMADQKYGRANVSQIPGMVLLPDAWVLPAGCSFSPMASNFSANSYSQAQWKAMEANGAVFLPAAGFRLISSPRDINVSGNYWSVSSVDKFSATSLYFANDTLNAMREDNNRYNGYSVRVVKNR